MKQRPTLVSGTLDVPDFDQEALITALRIDQGGESTFPEFLTSKWYAGVVRDKVDFAARTVDYFGCNGDRYIRTYPAVEVS